MSQENVEVVKRMIDAYNQRDLAGLEAFSHPDVELDWSASRGFVASVSKDLPNFSASGGATSMPSRRLLPSQNGSCS